MEKDYYKILGVSRDASEADIKKAYKKLAMQYHPDRNKWDQKSEARFKEVNEAYQVLGDAQKKRNYDQFGSSDFSQMWGGANPFWGFGGMGGNTGGFQGFEDLFSSFRGGNWSSGGFWFDIGDMFGQDRGSARSEVKAKTKAPSEELDVTKTIEIPFLDFLIDTTIDIETVYGKHLSLKVKAGTKPGTKYKITGKWRQNEGRTGDMYVIVDAKMPKEIPENIRPLLDAIRYQI